MKRDRKKRMETGPDSAGQGGATQQISDTAIADSESVEELAEEGNAFEADAIYGVESARDPDVAEVTTHEIPTAQHALRQAKRLAQNITASIRGKPTKPFVFSTIGQLATIGKRTGVANILGLRFSGFLAWWIWRTVYLSKLPRFEKKLRVAMDWTLDLVFSKDIVQFSKESGAQYLSHASQGEDRVNRAREQRQPTATNEAA